MLEELLKQEGVLKRYPTEKVLGVDNRQSGAIGCIDTNSEGIGGRLRRKGERDGSTRASYRLGCAVVVWRSWGGASAPMDGTRRPRPASSTRSAT